MKWVTSGLTCKKISKDGDSYKYKQKGDAEY